MIIISRIKNEKIRNIKIHKTKPSLPEVKSGNRMVEKCKLD